MSVTRAQVEHLAKLARLRLSEEELSGLESDLNAILSYFDQLQEVNTAGIEPMDHGGSQGALLEDDTPHECLPHELVLRDAPDRTVEFFRLPRVLGG
ncbi:MAG: Asp-tRNA(Asn)/Glu-tRNA(Gln) amidotransferase subunit GatC [Calditrichaeota bacterium]|nr:Asp-tRNA(Asn)/Glu-tRNA(Gln) amidotransferase subunit GatC [Calditrichota bacterium]MCB9366742.1 Asp-tRNA(Asn)/Glu-tRNA(Gln) amidotransferase subunit GatC [Calditrichota bacterium]